MIYDFTAHQTPFSVTDNKPSIYSTWDIKLCARSAYLKIGGEVRMNNRAPLLVPTPRKNIPKVQDFKTTCK